MSIIEDRDPSVSVHLDILTVRATREEVCGANQGKNREVPVALRRKVFELYGIPRADPQVYEVDDLITPALGGADVIGNLWPQSYSLQFGTLESKMPWKIASHELVCRGDLDLSSAQREISTDRVAAYKKYFRTEKPDSQ
jgi:hypothetical protein